MISSLIDRLFPLWRIRNIGLFYVLSAVYNMWFVAGIWVFFWGRFMSNTQIGISDSITFAIGFLVELPSGVFADVIGRKKAILIGNILLTIGNLLISFSSSFVGITTWYLVWTIGYAFQSGATEALAYDSLKKQGLEHDWHKVISAATVTGKATTLIATAVGGFLFLYWFRLPYLMIGLSGIIGVVAAFYLTEIKVYQKAVWSFSTYMQQVKDGVSTLLKRSIIPMSLLCLATLGIGYMYNWGLLRPLTGERFGYDPQAYSILLSVTSLVGIVAVGLLPRLRARFKIESLLLGCGGIFAVIFLLLGFDQSFLIGGLLMIVLSVVLNYVEIFFSQFINLRTQEEHRATTLSAVALFTKLPYTFLALLIGSLADSSLLATYTLSIGGIAIVAWLTAYFLYKKTNLADQH